MESHSETRVVDGATVELATVVHEGREFTNLGAVVADDYVVAYLGKDGKLTDWQGNVIGTYRTVSSWRTPNSWVSSTMSAVHAVVNGRTYKGRSAGVGMLFRGKIARA
jgi:hypothetical protein